MDWIIKNETWLFSGAAIFFISIVIKIVSYFWPKTHTIKAKPGNTINQTVGSNIKSKGDIVIKENKQKINI
jgi:hypothetical protein